jgi:hypothetical protein
MHERAELLVGLRLEVHMSWLIFRSDRRRSGIGRMANSSGIAGSGLLC